MKHSFILIILSVFYSLVGYSQIVTAPTLYATEDGHTYSGSTGTNYGTLGTMNVSVVTGPQYYRGFLKFNLTSIPSNAVITSALLKLTPSGTENVTAASQLRLDLCNTSWTETGITHSSNISSNPLIAPVAGLTNSTFTSAKRQFDIKDWVQAMVEGRLPNNGFRLKKTDETTVLNTTYFTRENATASNRPQLVIQYYLRPYVSAATIVHTSGLSTTDGSISPTITNGSNTVMNYRWYNSSGNQIATTQNLTGVGKGWYGLKFYGSTAGDTTYQAFIVGTECEDVSINFDATENYTDDTRLFNLIQGSGTTASDYSSVNEGTSFAHTAERNSSTNWYSTKSLMRFRIWIDPACQVNTANLTLIGYNHNTSGATNASEMALNTSNWWETGVAWFNTPTSTATGKINLASIPTGASNLTVNIASFFNTWKTNNPANYGFVFQLQSYTGDLLRRMQFLSSNNTLANRPQIAFSIRVNTCDLSRKGTTTVTSVPANDYYADISTTITPPSWAVSPYHYMISEQPVPTYSNIYHTLQYGDPSLPFKDTILIDSTTFFNVGETALTKSFEAIEPGQYFISVFDKLGTRIYDKQVSVNPINYEINSNIGFANDEFTTTAAGGKALIYSFINEQSEGASITFTVSNNSGETWFGLLNTSSGLNSKTDLVHGFTVSSGMASIVAGGSASSSFSVSPTDQFTITREGSNMKFYINGIYKTSAALPETFTYKVGLLGGSGDAGAAGVKIKYKPIKLISLKKAWNTITEIAPGSCMGSFGRVTGILNSFTFFTASMINPNTVLTSVATGLPQTMDAGSTATNYSFSNLLPGTYTLTNTFNWSTSPSVLVTFTTTVFVSSRIAWENIVNTTDVLPGATIPTSMVSTSTANGHATSVNEFPASGNTYVDFGVSLGGYVMNNLGSFYFLIPVGTGSANMGFYHPSVSIISTPIPTDFTGYRFHKMAFSPYIITKYQGGVFQGIVGTFTGNTRFRFLYDKPNDKGWLYKLLPNGTVGSVISGSDVQYSTSTSLEVKKLMTYLNTNAASRGFINVSTNMQCPSDFIYAKLERQLLGVKYKTYLNKFYFYYDEEYASTASLTYNVYDKNNTVVLKTSTQILANPAGNTNASGSIINREYADNRYSLDVTSLAAGSYVLEVINEKDEKLYLRFIK